MRIAIVGGGFFGFHIAEQLQRRHSGVHIEIFDRGAAPLQEAGTTNQCRLHMGFHYPRSGYTIYQSIMGFDRFVSEYGQYLEEVPNNLYAVHNDGLVTVEEYLAVMDSFHLPYERLPVSKELFRHPDEIGLLIRVPEKSINVKKLREELPLRFGGELHLDTPIDEIDSLRGMLRSGTTEFGPFDYVVNATYTNPNLGLPEPKHFAIKWEIAVMVLAKVMLPVGSAVTVMDGAFISVYPAYEGLHTLSSVFHTPMRRYSVYEDLVRDYPHRFQIAEREKTAEAIAKDVRSYINFEYEPKDLWVTAKTKLATDMGDSRVTEVRHDNRVFSVLCGKLDAVFEASDRILQEIQ